MRFGINEVDYGFIILCAERNIGGLSSTLRSIKSKFKCPILTVMPSDSTKKELEEVKLMSDVVKGKETYTSLINVGIIKSKAEWNFIIIAGSTIKSQFYNKYGRFLKDEKDILFPIIDFKCNFVEATINGILINRKAIKEVGYFDDGDLFLSKCSWYLKANDLGYKFKAIVGARIF